MNDQRLAGTAGDFEIAAGTAVAGRGIAVVTLLVCLDNPVSTNARDSGINAQGERPAIEGTRGGGRIVGQTQDPLAIGGLVAETGEIRNGLFRSERANEGCDARCDERCASIAERRREEVGSSRTVRNEFSLRAKGRSEENVEVRGGCVRDVNRRNDFTHDARLRDVDRADDARVVIGNGRGRRIGEDDGNFATAAGNIELTSARAAIAARGILVVALFEAADQAVAANRRTCAWRARTCPARFDDARRIAAIIGCRIAVITRFRAIDDAIATSNAIAHRARAVDHVRRAHRAVSGIGIRTRAGHRITRASDMALIGSHAADRIRAHACTRSAGIRLRTGVVIVARRPVIRGRIRTHTRHRVA